jgi:hypothetical protein
VNDELSAALQPYHRGRRCAQIVLATFGLVLLYLVKCLLGINLIPGLSLGIY